jgi:hypothetical protein
MSSNILKQFRNISLVLATSILIGCGGGGGGGSAAPSSNSDSSSPSTDTPPTDTPPTGIDTSVGGNTVDGPLFGSTVQVYNITDTSFASPLGSTTTSDGTDGNGIGSYSLNVTNIPDNFIVRVSGGTDAGDDGLANTPDDTANTTVFTSVVSKVKADKAHVSSATSLLLEQIKDDNATTTAQKIANAKASLKVTFGLADGVDLTELDPKSDIVASKAASFIAGVIKSMPGSDNTKALQSAAKVFKENNKTVATIKTESFSVSNDLNLSEIADEMELSVDDKTKITKFESTLKTILETKVQATNPVDTVKEDNTSTTASSNVIALDRVIKAMEENDANDMEPETLEKIYNSTKQVLKDVLDSNGSALDTKNLDVVLDVVENNLDTNLTALTSNVVDIAETTKKIYNDSSSDANLKKVVESMYENIDLNNSNAVDAVSNLLDNENSLSNLKDQIDTFKEDDNSDTILDTFGETLVSKANNEGNITAGDVNNTKTQLSDNDVGTALAFVKTKVDGNTTEHKLGLWLQKAIAINIESNTSIGTGVVEDFYNNTIIDNPNVDGNLTQKLSLRSAIFNTDLNDTVDKSSFDDNVTALQGQIDGFVNTANAQVGTGDIKSLDLVTSLACVEKRIISGTSIDQTCAVYNRIIKKSIVLAPTLFEPMTLLGIDSSSIPDVDLNTTLNY